MGIISDVHANIIALEAVLAKLEEHQVDQIICLGDLVGYGPFPNEVVELIRRKRILCTLGGADERVAFPFINADHRRGVADKIIEWTKTVISERSLEFLRTLPVQARLKIPSGRLRYFHSNMNSPSESLKIEDNMAQQMKILEEHRCQILALGKTHVPMVRELPTGFIINPGSVGLSLNGEPGADYSIVDARADKISVHMGKVEYDFSGVAFEVIAWDLPEVVAEAVQLGRMPNATPKGLENIKIQKFGRT
ncbi:MAG: metallophosphoesterase family protein [Deinococcales bacterium]